MSWYQAVLLADELPLHPAATAYSGPVMASCFRREAT